MFCAAQSDDFFVRRKLENEKKNSPERKLEFHGVVGGAWDVRLRPSPAPHPERLRPVVAVRAIARPWAHARLSSRPPLAAAGTKLKMFICI